MSKEEMNLDGKEPAARFAEYERRLKQLAADKSQLQLYADLINRLSLVKGVDNVSYQIVSLLMGTLGGTNITLFYVIGNTWHSMDASRTKSSQYGTPESSICEALVKKKNIFVDDKNDSQVLEINRSGDFRYGATWIIPLTFEDDVVGSIKMEGMLVVRPDMMDHLRPFINYASLVLKGEIENYSELKVAYDDIKEINKELSREIEERKKAQKDLQESEERFRSTFENALIGMCMTTVDGGFLMVNPAFCRMIGYHKHDLLGKNTSEFTHPDDVAVSYDNTRPLLDNKAESAYYEKRYIQKTGKTIWALVGTSLLRDARHNSQYLISHIEDITSRKSAEEKLKANEIKFRTFFEHVTDYALVLEPSEEGLIIVDLNAAACKKHGYLRQEMIGRNLNFLDVNLASTDDERLEKIVSGETLTYETIHKRKDGSTFSVEVISTKIVVEGKSFIFAIERDITDLKKMEENKTVLERHLQQAQKMESIGSLAGGIAHDLNNILFPITGLSEMLLYDIPPDNPAHESIEQILKSAQRGSDLVKQILAFSRQSNPKKLPIRIQPILKEVLKLARATIPMNIEITSHIRPDCGMVSANPTQVHQVMMNLITNAFHAVEKTGGIINVELKEMAAGWNIRQFHPAFGEKEDMPNHAMTGDLFAGGYACITVSDTGTGIDKALIDKIFDPYFTTKELGKGTGLGLSVVHGIVKEHGGDIRVYSEVGTGTVFHVYLPLLENAKDSMDAVDSRKYPTGCESILLVDDEAPIVRMEQMMLERLGYQVTVRTSSPDALDAFRADPSKFDLVISDRGMPNMTGEQLAGELISIRPGIPIILCTGFSDENDKQRAMMGIKGILMKPVATGDLAEMVRKVLDEVADSAVLPPVRPAGDVTAEDA